MGSTTLLSCNKQLVNLSLDYGRQKDDECSLEWFKAFQTHTPTTVVGVWQLTGLDLRHTPFLRTYSQKERASQSWKRPTVIHRQMNRVRVDSRDSQFVRVNVRFYECPQIWFSCVSWPWTAKIRKWAVRLQQQNVILFQGRERERDSTVTRTVHEMWLSFSTDYKQWNNDNLMWILLGRFSVLNTGNLEMIVVKMIIWGFL